MSQRKPYPSDLSDARWALIAPTLQAWRQARLDRRPTGQPASVALREVFNAILYVTEIELVMAAGSIMLIRWSDRSRRGSRGAGADGTGSFSVCVS